MAGWREWGISLYEPLHLCALAPYFIVPRKYSIVLLRPSSRPIMGCQERAVFARVISGRRCLGSSAGRGRWMIFDFEPVILMIFPARSPTDTSTGLPILTGPVKVSGVA